MATAAQKIALVAPSAAAAVAPLVKTVGKFSFAVIRSAPIPEEMPRASSVKNPMPFAELFAAMEHNDHFFVPSSFWTAPEAEGGRGNKPQKNPADQPKWEKGRMRDVFNAWKKAGGEKLNDRSLAIRSRVKGDTMTDGDTVVTFPEDGVSFWMVIAPVAAPEAAPEAPAPSA